MERKYSCKKSPHSGIGTSVIWLVAWLPAIDRIRFVTRRLDRYSYRYLEYRLPLRYCMRDVTRSPAAAGESDGTEDAPPAGTEWAR